MKRFLLLLFVFIFVFMVGTAFAGNVNLTATWEQPDYVRADRWVIFQSTTSGDPYLEIGTLTKAEAETDGITKEFNLGSPDGEKITYFFVIRAYDDDFGIASGNSNEVSFEVDFTSLPNPESLTITIKVISE